MVRVIKPRVKLYRNDLGGGGGGDKNHIKLAGGSLSYRSFVLPRVKL